jgi:hypothetical protein
VTLASLPKDFFLRSTDSSCIVGILRAVVCQWSKYNPNLVRPSSSAALVKRTRWHLQTSGFPISLSGKGLCIDGSAGVALFHRYGTVNVRLIGTSPG